MDFPEPTQSGNYMVPTLGIDEGTFIFTHLSLFLSYITPHDLPVELLRDAFHTKVSVFQLIMEALKIESGFICLIVMFFLISIIPLVCVIVWICSREDTITSSSDMNDGVERGNGGLPVDTLMALDESIGNTIHCRKRILQLLLHIVIICLIATITAMFITNEQIAVAVKKTPDVIRASLKDMELFLKDVHKQISFSLHEGMNTAIERIKMDFEEIDKLVGEPVQIELAKRTGIGDVFDTILGICSSNYEIIHRIQLLHDGIARAILISHEATTRTDELQIQLSVLQRQCTIRDRPLCETLRLKSFQENNFMESLIKLQTDPSLFKMLTLGEHQEGNGMTRNLSTELRIAREIFGNFSTLTKEGVAKQRDDLFDCFTTMKDAAVFASKILATTIRSIIDSIDRSWSTTTPILDNLDDLANMLWNFALLSAVFILVITMMLMCGLSYGCCQSENRAGSTFIIGATSISVGSIALSSFVVFAMLLGGHGEVLLCRPLYDKPNYHLLAKLLDKPGMAFANGTINGIVGDIFRPPMSGVTTFNNATLSSVLTKCELNGASYHVFQMEGFMNASKISDLNEYPELLNSIEKLTISTASFSELTNPLQQILEYMFVNSNINLSAFRSELNAPSPERDLSTFIDQMQRVSLQIQDIATSSRMTTLGNRARRLLASVLQPLEQIRSDIIFQLTAMELQREPWLTQVNHSLLHLKSAQFFLNQDASDISLRQIKLFRERLKNHLLAYNINLKSILNERIASCRPLYNVFNVNRILLCRHTMDPLNGLWFSGLLAMLLWSLATPLALSLASIYKRLNCARGLRHTNSHQYGAPTDSLIISEQSNWAAESSQRTSGIDRSNW